eukprot:c12740_g2_i1.p1 GENE.c12740_g2_i1~~c12740_g2_i1.p1  ORF type:complete len:133 (+),score=48.51 c12740_g2_i1:49-399(+)
MMKIIFFVLLLQTISCFKEFDNVQLQNLKATEFNGKTGIIESKKDDRWVVRIQGIEDTFALKEENLILLKPYRIENKALAPNQIFVDESKHMDLSLFFPKQPDLGKPKSNISVKKV